MFRFFHAERRESKGVIWTYGTQYATGSLFRRRPSLVCIMFPSKGNGCHDKRYTRRAERIRTHGAKAALMNRRRAGTFSWSGVLYVRRYVHFGEGVQS